MAEGAEVGLHGGAGALIGFNSPQAKIAVSGNKWVNLDPAVHPRYGQARPLVPAISNCGAAHPSGDNRFFRNRLSRGTIRVSSGRDCRILVKGSHRAAMRHGENLENGVAGQERAPCLPVI